MEWNSHNFYFYFYGWYEAIPPFVTGGFVDNILLHGTFAYSHISQKTDRTNDFYPVDIVPMIISNIFNQTCIRTQEVLLDAKLANLMLLP